MLSGWAFLRGLPRAVWLLSIAAFANRVGTMALPFFVLYMTKQLGFSDSQAAAAMSIYGASSLASVLVAGRLTDRFGPLPVLRVSLISSGLVLVTFPLLRSHAAVIAGTIVWSVTAEAFRPSVMAAIGLFAPPELRRNAFALLRLAVNLGMSIGPAAGGLLAAISFSSIYWIDGATSLIAAAVLLLAMPPHAEGPQRSGHGAPAPAGWGFDRRLAMLLIGAFLTAATFFQTQGVLGPFLDRQLGLGTAVLGGVFTINTGLIILFEVPLLARISDWPHRRLLGIGSLFYAVGFGSIALTRGVWSLAASTVFWTIGEMVTFSTMSSYVAEISPRGKQGAWMSYYTMAFGLAFIVGPGAGIQLYNMIGPKSPWVVFAAVALLAGAVFVKLPLVGMTSPNAPQSSSSGH